MSVGNMDLLMNLMASMGEHDEPPFSSAKDILNTIDSIPLCDIPWEGFKISYTGEKSATSPSWMEKEFEVWYRNPLKVMEQQIGNPDFAHEVDFSPKQVINPRNKKRQYKDLMSGQWSWDQAVRFLPPIS